MKAFAVVRSSLWPSFKRAVASIFSAFTLPFFLLAVVSLIKVFGALGWIELSSALKHLVQLQSEAIGHLQGYLARIGLSVPQWVIDGAVIYMFIGGTMVRAERDELLAVILDPGTHWQTFRAGLSGGRIEFMFYAVPMILRAWTVRLAWPLVAIYRWGTPYVVVGPGPTGDEISTSVPRSDIGQFLAHVAEHGMIDRQVVYDHRQVLVWEFALSGGAALGVTVVSALAA